MKSRRGREIWFTSGAKAPRNEKNKGLSARLKPSPSERRLQRSCPATCDSRAPSKLLMKQAVVKSSFGDCCMDCMKRAIVILVACRREAAEGAGRGRQCGCVY